MSILPLAAMLLSAKTSPVTQGALATTPQPGASSSWTVNLPASIAAGELLLIFIFGNNSAVPSAAGWTALSLGAFSTVNVYCLRKTATGSEGATVTVAMTASASGGAWATRVTGADLSQAPAVATQSGGTTATLANPTVTPSWGGAPNLYFSIVAFGNLPRTVSAYPYANDNSTLSTALFAGAICDLGKPAQTSETPASWTMSTTGAAGSQTFTVAIKPA